MSRILIWSPNYAPELLGIPPLVTDAAEWLAARGHEIDVVTAVPNYPERRIHAEYRWRVWTTEQRGAVRVARSWIRVRPSERFLDKVLYEASFGAFSGIHAFVRVMRSDAVLCTVPCLSSALEAAALVRMAAGLRRRPRLVLWVQDLVLSAALAMRDVGPLERKILGLARSVESMAFRGADRVVVCSPGFTEYVRELGVGADRVRLIYNWAPIAGSPGEAVEANGGRPTRFLYTGNLGYTQGFETLVEAAGLAGSDVEVVLVGHGNAASHVRALAAAAPNIRVEKPVDAAEYPGLLASADVQVVIQRAVSANANFPSKIASYLASGRPVLAAIARESAAAQTLTESGGAIVVPPDDAQALARAMQRLHREPQLRRALGQRGREYAEHTFDRSEALTQLEDELVG